MVDSDDSLYDGAGNPSATALPVATISIEQVTLPQVMLPMVLR
ncbi:MAG: hypothetical protein ACP5UR_13620 [Chloroflexus sp.]